MNRSSDEPDVVYLSRLAASPTTVTATELGRGLIADDLRAQLAGIGAEPRYEGHQPEQPKPQPDDPSFRPFDPRMRRPEPPANPGPNPRP